MKRFLLSIVTPFLLAQAPSFTGDWIELSNGQFINSDIKISPNYLQSRVYLVKTTLNEIEYNFFYIGLCDTGEVSLIGTDAYQNGDQIKRERYEESSYLPPDPLEGEAFEYACNY